MTENNSNNLKELVSYAVSLGEDLAQRKNDHVVEEISGDTYLFIDGTYKRVDKYEHEAPKCVEVFSLRGLCDLIKADVDGLFANEERRHIVRVTSPYLVEVLSPLYGEHKNRRDVVMRCAFRPEAIPFDTFMSAEDFVILLMTLAANIRDEDSVSTADNGYGQNITVRRGIVTCGETKVENPVPLTPLRIFPEVEQPRSPFVLRFQSGEDAEKKRVARVALFEADGGAWEMAAVANIRDWLRAQIGYLNVDVIG